METSEQTSVNAIPKYRKPSDEELYAEYARLLKHFKIANKLLKSGVELERGNRIVLWMYKNISLYSDLKRMFERGDGNEKQTTNKTRG